MTTFKEAVVLQRVDRGGEIGDAMGGKEIGHGLKFATVIEK